MINERIEDGIVIASFENGKNNTITRVTLRQLQAILRNVNTDDSLKGIVLTGSEKVFSSGFDLPMFLGFKEVDEVIAFFELEEDVLLDLFMCRKPVIAAINGHAVAGGLIMAMASDYRVVKDHPKIKLGMSEIKIGLPLSIAQTEVMRFGFDSDKLYRDIMYFGELFNPARGLELGIVDEIVAEEQLIVRAKDLISRFIDQPGRAFIKLKESLKKPAADRIRGRLANEDWREGFKCFFDPAVRSTLDFVQNMM
ncbi:MAG: enoyl-CoA hydratase/isomerase family protein [Syntrophaceae bacterium]